jgi:hypothetical protein
MGQYAPTWASEQRWCSARGRGSPSLAIVPVRSRFEAKRSWYPTSVTRPSSSAVWRVAAEPRWMSARPEEDVDVQCGGNSSQDFEANALGQAVLDHRPGALADPACGAQPCLSLEPGEAEFAQLDGKVEDHLLDRRRLVAELIWHDRIPPGDHHRGLNRRSSIDLTRVKGSCGTPAPAAISQRKSSQLVMSGARASAQHLTGGYNRHLTGGGTAKPRLARPPGGPIA